MKLSRKGTMELSLGFLVTIIITIVIFGFSIIFLKNLFTGATEISYELDTRTQQQIESLLSQGQKVAVPFNRREIRVGESGMFGVGIYNIAGANAIFKLNVSGGKDPKTGLEVLPVSNVLYTDTLEIKNNEQDSSGILVAIPDGTRRGTYVLDVVVKCEKAPPLSGACNAQEPVYGWLKIYAEVI